MQMKDPCTEKKKKKLKHRVEIPFPYHSYSREDGKRKHAWEPTEMC